GISYGKKHQEGKIYSGQLAWLQNFRERLPHFMSNFSGSVHAGRVVSPFLSGRNLYGDFRLRGLLPGMKQLEGKMDAVLGPGTIYQLERMAQKEKALDVAFKPFLAMHKMEMSGAFKADAVLRDVNYTAMAGSVDFKNGAMDVRYFFLAG
ncbi:MAG: hypothetical protein WC822_07520, partial [Candidatus Paceibacterota bacterium]